MNKMLVVLKITIAIVVTVVFVKVLGYIQCDHFICPVTDVNGNLVTVEAYNGNLYVFETENENEYEVGEMVKVDFFDLEDFDVTNNVVVKATKIN